MKPRGPRGVCSTKSIRSDVMVARGLRNRPVSMTIAILTGRSAAESIPHRPIRMQPKPSKLRKCAKQSQRETVFNCLSFKELHPPGSIISTRNKPDSASFGLINQTQFPSRAGIRSPYVVGSRIEPVAMRSSRSSTRSESLSRNSRVVVRLLAVRGSMRPPTSWKWINPTVSSRVEQRLDGSRLLVDRGQITTLPGIAQRARQSQVLGRGCTAMLFGDDVVDGVQCPRHCLGYEAVLAAFAGTFTNKAAQGGGDVRRVTSQ